METQRTSTNPSCAAEGHAYAAAQALDNNSRPCILETWELVLRIQKEENAVVPCYFYNNSDTMAPTITETPATVNVLTEMLGAALLPVDEGEAPDPVTVPWPAPPDWTLLLEDEQVYAPLMTFVFWSCSKGVQSMSPELCKLNVPLQSSREGRVTLYVVRIKRPLQRERVCNRQAYFVKFPVISIAPVDLRDPKPSIDMRLVLLAIVRPPPTVVNTGMEILERSALAMIARSPLTAVRLGQTMSDK